MPVRNEAPWIAHSLHAVLKQRYPQPIEIIVVDGMSEDNTTDVVAHTVGNTVVQLLRNEKRVQAAGLNMGIQHAKGEVIVRVDARAIIAPDYVQRCIDALHESRAQNVGGRINPVGLTITGQAIAIASRSRFAVPSAFRVTNTARYVDTVYMGAWYRSDLVRIGGFDERLAINEDYELNYRIRRFGGSIYLSPLICSNYFVPPSGIKLAQQYFRYGAWKPYTILIHPTSLKLRHLVAPAFIFYLSAGVAGSILQPSLRLWWITGLLLYLFTNFIVSIAIGWRRLDLLWRLPLVFITIHFSWGLGFWWGMIPRLRAWLRSQQTGFP